ncbi:MAG: hypothetical protein WCF18_05050 [Chthoniobacteraceae bacterium]
MSMPVPRFEILRGMLIISVGAAVVWWGGGQLIAPYLGRAQVTRSAIDELREKIDGARTAIREAQKLDNAAEAMRWQIERMDQEIPAGPGMVWLPELVKQHFAAFGLTVSIVRMNTVREEPEMPGYSRGYWSVGLPILDGNHNAEGSLLAVAEFERLHPFISVLDFAIRADPENPQRRLAVLNVAAFIRK